MTDVARPAADIEGCTRAHRAVLADLERHELDPVTPSRLPGWTIGHLVTHLARNADSFVGIFEAANRGEVGFQYPGGPAQRADDIEAGAPRTRTSLIEDVRGACARLEAIWGVTSDDVWRDGKGKTAELIAVRAIPARRWREVAVHHVDLGIGYETTDWPDDFVARLLIDVPSLVAPRLPEGATLRYEASDSSWQAGDERGTAVRAPARELVAWALGRAVIPDAPELAPF